MDGFFHEHSSFNLLFYGPCIRLDTTHDLLTIKRRKSFTNDLGKIPVPDRTEREVTYESRVIDRVPH